MIKIIKGMLGLIFLVLFMAVLCTSAVAAIPFVLCICLLIAASDGPNKPSAPAFA